MNGFCAGASAEGLDEPASEIRGKGENFPHSRVGTCVSLNTLEVTLQW
jgi:hypothetical protein